MKRLIVPLLMALTVPATVYACDGEHHADAQKPKSVTVVELAKLQQDKKVAVFDANSQDFRQKNGVIPGAVLLSSAVQYDPAKELPAQKDSKLVFYCASTKCSASHKAAEKALEAGYKDVSVLPDGLTGWKSAGQKTDNVKPNS